MAMKHQERESSVIAKETTSTGWKGSGATSNAGSLQKAASVKKGFNLYLAEYVWRYTHRNESIKMQKKQLLKLLEVVNI